MVKYELKTIKTSYEKTNTKVKKKNYWYANLKR